MMNPFVGALSVLAQAAAPVQFDIVAMLVRLFHTLPAAMLAGGIAYQRFILCCDDPTIAHSLAAGDAPRRRWAAMVGMATFMLMASGLYRLVLEFQTYKLPVAYHILFLVKFLLAMFVFFVSAVLAGRSSLAVKFRQRYRFWLTLNLGAVFALVIVAAAMRAVPREPKAPKPAEATTPAATAAACPAAPVLRKLDVRA